MTATELGVSPSGRVRTVLAATHPEEPLPDVDLRVSLGRGFELPNPITTASGCAASGRELDRFYDLADLGAVVVKSVTLEPRDGLPTPRMHETSAGMLNAIGLQNPGVDAWVARDLPWLVEHDARVVASIAGKSVEEFRAVAARLRRAQGIAAVEINLSCPNVAHRGLVFACHAAPSAAVVAAVREELPRMPLLAKLTPDVTDVVEIARAAVGAGADGLTLINTTLGMAVDPETGRARLANTVGGLSGPAIKPIAVRVIHQVHTALPDAPILGTGGVRSVADVVELLRVGASAVAVGTATFADPFAPRRLVDELRTWCAVRGIAAVVDLRGTVIEDGGRP